MIASSKVTLRVGFSVDLSHWSETFILVLSSLEPDEVVDLLDKDILEKALFIDIFVGDCLPEHSDPYVESIEGSDTAEIVRKCFVMYRFHNLLSTSALFTKHHLSPITLICRDKLMLTQENFRRIFLSCL